MVFRSSAGSRSRGESRWFNSVLDDHDRLETATVVSDLHLVALLRTVIDGR
jgi:hypothetical protein